MRRNSCLVVLIFSFLLGFTAQAQTKENVKAVMASKWIGKYKKLKNDLESKAATVKEMDDISDEDFALLRKSYTETSKLLEGWLNNLVNTLEKADPATVDYFAKGELSPELQTEFQTLGTFYANDFSTLYEEITGLKTRMVISLKDNGNPERDLPPSHIVWKFDREELTAGIQSLIPADWNSIN